MSKVLEAGHSPQSLVERLCEEAVLGRPFAIFLVTGNRLPLEKAGLDGDFPQESDVTRLSQCTGILDRRVGSPGKPLDVDELKGIRALADTISFLAAPNLPSQ